MFLNDYDLRNVLHDSDRAETPNLHSLATIVCELAAWADRNSDGWAYWPKPSRAASRATDILYREFLGRYDQRTGQDITKAELQAAVRPIKAFRTRQANGN